MTTIALRPAYREAPYLRYVAGQAVSVLGDQVWYVALSWTAVQLVSPAVAGIIFTVSALPRLALMLFGGAIVDRYGPRRLMIHSDAARAVISLAAAAIALRWPDIALLVALALIFGIADAVFLPAASAMQPRLLESTQYSSGNALTTLTSRAALTVGAPLGGVLVAFGGLPLACVVNAATFAVSVLALWSVHPRQSSGTGPAPRGPLLSSIREGLSYLSGQRVLGTLLMVGLLCNLGFVGPMNLGLALLSTDRGWGAAGIGAMLAGFGVGACVSGLAMLRLRPAGPAGLMIAGCVALQGVAVIVPAFTARLAVAVAATAIAGLTSGPAAILMSTLNQSRTGDAFRGRVGSVNALLNLGLVPLGIAAMGWAAATIGLTAAITISGALELIAAVVCLRLRHERI